MRRARRAYVGDLDDRIATLQLTASLLTGHPELVRGIRDGDRAAGAAAAASFAKLYPDADLVLVKQGGTVVASVGCDSETVSERSIVLGALSEQGLSGRGCGGTREPTYLVARPTAGGALVVGFRFTEERLASTWKKVGLALAMVDSKERIVHQTPDFPAGGETVQVDERRLIELGDKTYIVERFTDERLTSVRGRSFYLLAARDVTRLKGRLYRRRSP